MLKLDKLQDMKQVIQDWSNFLWEVCQHTIKLLPDSISMLLKFLASGTTCSPTLHPCSSQDRSINNTESIIKHEYHKVSIHTLQYDLVT